MWGHCRPPGWVLGGCRAGAKGLPGHPDPRHPLPPLLPQGWVPGAPQAQGDPQPPGAAGQRGGPLPSGVSGGELVGPVPLRRAQEPQRARGSRLHPPSRGGGGSWGNPPAALPLCAWVRGGTRGHTGLGRQRPGGAPAPQPGCGGGPRAPRLRGVAGTLPPWAAGRGAGDGAEGGGWGAPQGWASTPRPLGTR